MTRNYEEIKQRLLDEKNKTQIRPVIGLLPTGHFRYWPQFPKLKAMGTKMYKDLLAMLEQWADVVVPVLVDTSEKSVQAGEFFRKYANWLVGGLLAVSKRSRRSQPSPISVGLPSIPPGGSPASRLTRPRS